MKKLLHIPNCWHEQIANAYDLELVTDNPDIIILRDPFDRAVEATVDLLDSGGETNGLTFEELLFQDNNIYSKALRITTGTADELKQKMFEFVWLSSYIVWPRITGELHPKEQTKPLERFNLTSTSKKLSDYLSVPHQQLNVNQRFTSSDLGTALRGDFQLANSMDYDLVRKLKIYTDKGRYYE
tara:strand:+ start:15402 stop:15953 length:552 start_codon:yes stop_codon:yes gene_type:complete